MTLEQNLEQIWPLSNVVIEQTLKSVAGQRQVQVLNTSEGKYILKTADESKSAAALASGLLIFDFLPAHGFSHIPTLLKTNSKELSAEINGQRLYILSYVDGVQPPATPDTYSKLGQITAQLHLTRNYPDPTKFSPEVIIINDLPNLTTSQPFHDKYRNLLKDLPDFRGLPSALIHTDIAPVNAVKTIDEDIVLIDWDDAGIGIRVLDVAFPLIQQFVSEDCEYDQTSSKAFYAAYKNSADLTDAELDNLFGAALFIAMMYIVYGDSGKRWKRILWAIENRRLLEEVYR